MKPMTVDIKINEGSSYRIHRVILDFTNRTLPVQTRGYEDGRFYYVHTWVNHDGSITTYNQALEESMTNGLNPELVEVW